MTEAEIKQKCALGHNYLFTIRNGVLEILAGHPLFEIILAERDCRPIHVPHTPQKTEVAEEVKHSYGWDRFREMFVLRFEALMGNTERERTDFIEKFWVDLQETVISLYGIRGYILVQNRRSYQFSR